MKVDIPEREDAHYAPPDPMNTPVKHYQGDRCRIDNRHKSDEP